MSLFAGGSRMRPPTNFEKVRHFMRVMGQATPAHLIWPDQATIDLRIRLIQEELKELIEDGFEPRNMIEVADAIGDLLYVVYGTAAAMGIDADAIFDEVHSSNMTKIGPDGTVIRDERGKVKKPPTFREPDIAKVLAQRIQPDVNPFE